MEAPAPKSPSIERQQDSMSSSDDASRALVDLAIEGPAPYLIRRLQQIVTAIFADEMLEFDVTAPQYAALSVIVATPNLDQNTTAYLAGVERSTIVGVINRLVTKGLVRRTFPKADRRVRLLQPTRAGIQFVDRVRENVDRIGSRLLACLTETERATFCETIRRILREPLRAEAQLINSDRLIKPAVTELKGARAKRRPQAKARSQSR